MRGEIVQWITRIAKLRNIYQRERLECGRRNTTGRSNLLPRAFCDSAKDTPNSSNAYFSASKASQAFAQRRHASPQIRQCSIFTLCLLHIAPQLSQAWMHARSCAPASLKSVRVNREMIRAVARQTSAQSLQSRMHSTIRATSFSPRQASAQALQASVHA